ncbi:mediator of RNA polymerase II transcription subunit 1-like isoform X2 [Tympanuchus pallidicinctus]|uniref:mediator of RNA polymerase II transcription subunit 1-like isoform X2 n=1 Tax=Tympanuchus pallidicinctus TaxID=109042 RepID=UPI00228742E8|nr:mediator of RNA polymerase II transcription subunit 1-like isoform X2 [Tympanuchus pallidicinctus]
MEEQGGQQPLLLFSFCRPQGMSAVAVISTNALMEQLYLKYQQRPWTETLKLVHFCMDKPRPSPASNAPDAPLLSCMEKLQRTLNDKSLFSVMNRLESLAKQKGLNSHVSPSGTACYITSDMFYIEVQLEKDGRVMDVKLAHLGEAPVICDDLVQHLRMKNYDAFGKILEDLSNLYQIPGNSEMKAKGYLALQSLEKDLYSMSLLHRSQDVNRVTEVLHGKVGHLVPRTGGTPMNIEFYISPYQILEAELNPGSLVCGTKAVVTVEGTDVLHKLPLSPLVVDSQAGEDGNPTFLPLTNELSMDLSAYFLLKFHQPIPLSLSSIEEIQMLTGIQITALKLAPLYELIIQSALKEKGREDLSTHNSCFIVSLPDCPKHCYFINKGPEKSNLAGALLSKIPFTHPKCVPAVIEILRHQVAYNSLISSCVSDKCLSEDDSELLYFEVTPHKNTSFSVFFIHPTRENLACVTIDVVTSREVQCSLHLHPEDPTLNSSDGFISRSVKCCMSVPVVMRAIFRNAAKVGADSETHGTEVDTKQKPELQREQITDSNSLEERPSVAGQEDLVKTNMESVPDSPEQTLSTAKLETLGDEMEKSNTTVSTETLSGVGGSDSTASTEAARKDK